MGGKIWEKGKEEEGANQGFQYLGTFATNTTSQLDILGHDRNPLGMDGAKVGILEQSNQVCLTCLLKCQYGRGLETQIGLEVLGNLTDQTLEGCLADQKFGGLLILTDLT